MKKADLFFLFLYILLQTNGYCQSLMEVIRKESVTISSHRGVSILGKEENSIQSMSEALSKGIKLHEIDIMESRDGKLYLSHDETLDRTTSIQGKVSDLPSSVLEKAVLKGSLEPLPTFKDALCWAKENDAYLMLDVKAAPVANVMDEVKAMDMMDRVMLLTFSKERTYEALAYPEKFLISALVEEIADIGYFVNIFPDNEFFIGYINKTAAIEIYQQARKSGVTILTDTMGERDILAKEDEGKSYVNFIKEKKPDILVSDYPLLVKHALNIQF